jgi:hypothetical protein
MRKTRMILILGLALAAVAVLAAEISIDADRTLDYSAFKTYAWKANDKASDPLVDQAIVADIEEQLAAKGLKKVEGQPDLFVQYHVILQKEAKLTDWDEGKFKFENRNITVERLTIGTLLVDLVDAKSGAVVWEAAGKDYVTAKAFSPEFAEGLKRNIGLMFTMYPPKKS